MGQGPSKGAVETATSTVMQNFGLHQVPSRYHFYIRPDHHGHWIVRERRNLAGGVFLTREGAMKFALSETGGDASHVHSKFDAAQRRGGVS
jgi:hypothetical protein